MLIHRQVVHLHIILSKFRAYPMLCSYVWTCALTLTVSRIAAHQG